MDKREIVIRIVDSSTGEIFNETRKKLVTNFWHKKDRNDLHGFLDVFIDRVKNSDSDSSICIDFIADVPYVQSKLPF